MKSTFDACYPKKIESLKERSVDGSNTATRAVIFLRRTICPNTWPTMNTDDATLQRMPEYSYRGIVSPSFVSPTPCSLERRGSRRFFPINPFPSNLFKIFVSICAIDGPRRIINGRKEKKYVTRGLEQQGGRTMAIGGKL